MIFVFGFLASSGDGGVGVEEANIVVLLFVQNLLEVVTEILGSSDGVTSLYPPLIGQSFQELRRRRRLREQLVLDVVLIVVVLVVVLFALLFLFPARVLILLVLFRK